MGAKIYKILPCRLREIPCGILHRIATEHYVFHGNFCGEFHMESHGVSMENVTCFAPLELH